MAVKHKVIRNYALCLGASHRSFSMVRLREISILKSCPLATEIHCCSFGQPSSTYSVQSSRREQAGTLNNNHTSPSCLQFGTAPLYRTCKWDPLNHYPTPAVLWCQRMVGIALGRNILRGLKQADVSSGKPSRLRVQRDVPRLPAGIAASRPSF